METSEPNVGGQKNSPGGSSTGSSTHPQSSSASLPQIPQGKYSFIHKVVDGITIIVNTVNVKFLSAAFTASVQVGIVSTMSVKTKRMSINFCVFVFFSFCMLCADVTHTS